MKKLWPLFLLPIALMAPNAGAADPVACPPGVTCVPPEDMKVFVQLLKEQKCRAETPPTFKVDPVQITIDNDGRVYGTGSTPTPYKVHFDWCNYKVDGAGQTSIVAAKREAETWGWRFRVKAAPGFLPLTALNAKEASKGIDLGVLIEPFFVQWSNVNAYVGIRSVGGGFGFDLTKNFGVYAGYAITWGSWEHNLHGAMSFALW